jgi:hypothetical protein
MSNECKKLKDFEATVSEVEAATKKRTAVGKEPKPAASKMLPVNNERTSRTVAPEQVALLLSR